MKFRLIIISILIGFTLSAQDEVKRNIYYGNIAYHNESFDEAMTYYEKAITESPFDYNANYNMANTYFKLEIYDKATEKYEALLNQTNDIAKKAMLHHNIGNCNLVNNKLDDAIESYKASLRLMPNSEATRYNLAFALEMKKQKEQQQKEEQQDKQEGNPEDSSDGNENQSNSDENSDSQNNSEDDANEQEEKEDNQEEKDNTESEEKEGDQNEDENNDSQQKEETDKTSETRKNALKILEEANKKEKEIQEMIIKNKGKKNANKKNKSTTKKDW